MASNGNICIFKKETDKPIFLIQKGADGVNNASSKRNLDIVAVTGSIVCSCRKHYVDKKNFSCNKQTDSTNQEDPPIRKKRWSDVKERHQISLFCDNIVDFEDSKYGAEKDALQVEILSHRQS